MTPRVTVKQLPTRSSTQRVRLRRDFKAMEQRRMRAAGGAGRRPKLSTAQLAEVEQALAKGAEANGYTTDLWTLSRVAEVIEQVTGVSYHPGHVWYVLRDQLNWTWQRPARRAVERNDEAIERWVKKRWPQLKKGHDARTH